MRNISYFVLTFVLVILLARFNAAKENKNAGDDEMCGLDGGKGCDGKEEHKEETKVDTSVDETVITKVKIDGMDEDEIDETLNKEQTEEQEYLKGSACSYCSYCKFCTLCDKDCPCKTSAKKPNCAMCKYCKYCNLCKGCGTVCQPGGIVDRFSSYLSNNLPKFSKEDVERDIKKVKEYVDSYRIEL